ncbi:MAG: CBS domain-containing protein [Alphaproteobacteria bacterium]|nr:CBS domain-containing protein [Alphaproteobacteria bacterium]
MKKRVPISKIMTKRVIRVHKNQSLQQVAKLIRDRPIRHVPVMSGKEIEGMLSKTDLEKISFVNTIDGNKLTTLMYDVLTIEQVMTKDVLTIQHKDTVYDAALLLSENEFHALPVMDEDELVGIVTTTDLIKFLLTLF